MNNKLTYVEQDSGLWAVYRGEREIGYIWDAGRLGRESGEYCSEYQVLDGWNNIVPGNLIAKAPTFMGAVKMLNTSDKRTQEFETILQQDGTFTLGEYEWEHA